MGRAKYVGELREDLINLDWTEFHQKHPDIKRNTYKGKRSYWAKQLGLNLKEMRMEREEGKLTKTWEVSAFNRETNEWETTTNHAYDHAIDPEDIWQAEPANITPSRRKPIQRPGVKEDIFILTDTQIGYRAIMNRETGKREHVPLHDERKLRVARRIAFDIRPTMIVNLGDNIDLAEFSHFDPDSDHFDNMTLEHSLQTVHDEYAKYRSDHPDAELIETSSNHNERFNKLILKKVAGMYNVRRAESDSKYPVMSYAYMANLEHLGVEFIEGYPVGTLIIPRGDKAPLRFAHNTETSSGASSAASKVMKNHPETFNFGGHDHKDSEAWHTLNNGEQVGTFVFGALANARGLVPGYRSAVTSYGEPVDYQQNWTASVGRVRLYENDEVEVERIMIKHDGTSIYNGRFYDGNES